MGLFGVNVKGSAAKVGRLATQAVKKTDKAKTEGDGDAASGVNFVPSSDQVARAAAESTDVESTPLRTQVKPEVITPAVKDVNLNVARAVPKIRFQIPPFQEEDLQELSEDTLDVSETRVRNEQFVPVEEDGISSFRPEILSVVDFQPIWQDKPASRLSPAGKLLNAQYNSLWLRRDTLVKLLKRIRNSNQDQVENAFTELREDFKAQTSRINRTVDYYTQFIGQIEAIKSSFDIKQISPGSFEEEDLSIDDFFERRMSISKNNLSNFSDTKILLQLLFDFREMLENYSLNLLDLTDPDRQNDVSPVKIDRTYTLSDGFAFRINKIRSEEEPVNATKRSFFNDFLNSLPNNPDDRIKLLTTLLSKEYRVSKGLGLTATQNALEGNFGAGSTGNPFDNIVGEPGDTIFEQPVGENSLASLFNLPFTDNSSVLPFERKYVDSEDTKKTFIPGSTFFADSILQVEGDNFNTRPLVEYVDRFSSRFSQAQRLIRSLLEFDTFRSPIAALEMNDGILESLKNATSGIATDKVSEFFGIDIDQGLITALFKQANEDNILKNQLFQYILLAGMASNTENDQKPVFTSLATELQTPENLSAVSLKGDSIPNLNGGVEELKPLLERLADDIIDRLFELVTPTTKEQTEGQREDTESESNQEGITTTAVAKAAFDKTNLGTLDEGQTTVEFRRPQIRRILNSIVEPRKYSASNLIQEFIEIANRFVQGASIEGEKVFLLDDNSGRTRYNFISTSTQLLLLFEVYASYAEKYAFARFIRSSSTKKAPAIFDTDKNDFIQRTIEDILASKKLNLTKENFSEFASSKLESTVKPLGDFNPFSSPFQTFLEATKSTIVRGADSEKSTGEDKRLAGFFSSLNVDEKDTVEKNLDSPFLGKNLISKFGQIKIDQKDFEPKTNSLRSALNTIRNKITEEDRTQQNVLGILSVIEERLRNGKSRALNAFSQQVLSAFTEENELRDLEIARSPAQVRLAAFLQREVLQQTKENNQVRDKPSDISLLDDEVVTPQTKQALFSLLSETQFLRESTADKRIKIMSVGVPAGFSRALSDRIQQADINQRTFKQKQFDVVSVNVYKRDTQYDDVVFKPQRFTFDLSLFASPDWTFTQPREQENFERILQRNSLLDFASPKNPEARSLSTIRDNAEYDFLTNQQKRELIRNHSVSSLMGLYVELLAGLRINEGIFSKREIDVSSQVNERFIEVVKNYIRNELNLDLPNQSINQLLQNQEVSEEAKDILRLTTFGSIAFEPKALRERILSPKLFDRIFTLAVDTEQFPIDEEATKETESGRKALNQESLQEQLVERDGETFFVPRDRNDLLFEDFFVTIENGV